MKIGIIDNVKIRIRTHDPYSVGEQEGTPIMDIIKELHHDA